MTRANKLPAITALLCFSAGALAADLEELAQNLLDAGAAGFAMALIDKDGIYWSSAHGHADIDADRPMTTDTVMNIASISKTVTGLSLMLLVERGDLDLDTRKVPAHSRQLGFRGDTANHRVVMGTPHELGSHVVWPRSTRRVGPYAERDVEHDLMVILPVHQLEQRSVRLGQARVELEEPNVVGLIVPVELDVEWSPSVSRVGQKPLGHIHHPTKGSTHVGLLLRE